ncbi:uncharacterized protein LOC110726274 [Chenopodium quinoa]|uniref:uncharacterized protein LOC110726274 n=1 Tax=Chenopodium quinoa TaxID=63459 RepID=UPI000B7804E0|nr:uncharacterized protein LOC110726274 [Chenopodium quinoa]
MASQNVVLLCRWGGEILFDGPRVEYSGGNMEPLTLELNMTMNDLMNEVHSSIGSDPMTVDVHIKMRFETGNGVQVLPVSTNKHVTALRNVVAMKGVPTEIYVETVPICTQQSTRPEQLHSYSPTQDDGQASPSQHAPNHLEDIVNNELSVYDVYTNDEADSGEEEDGLQNMDVEPARMEVGEPLVRTPIPWFSQRNQFYTTITSNESVLHLRCKKKCGWMLRGTKSSKHSRGFALVTYKGPHRENCVTEVLSTDHPHLDSSLISDFVKSFVRKDPSLKVEFIQELISKQFHFDVPYRRAWYAKGKAIADIYGDWESSYGRLPHFMQALQQSNPGTCVVWKYKALVDGVYYSNMEVFERVFWAFGPCIDGFKHCMSVICIDGTHLYGKYKGTLLVATSVDANFQVFPLAFALVEGENTSSWSWFLGCIRVHVTQRDGLCVISDRHPGIRGETNSG